MRKTLLSAAVLCAAGLTPAAAQAHCCWRDGPVAVVEPLAAEELNVGVYVVYEPPLGPSLFPYRGPRYRLARWHRSRVRVHPPTYYK